MEEKTIIEEVIRYLGDSNYRYALLLDGEWGCGKTHFVLNDLKKAIEECKQDYCRKEIKYVSLYGCKSIEDLEENIYWSIIDEKFFAMKDKISEKLRNKEVYGEKKEKRKRNDEKFWTISKKIVGTAMQKFDLNYKAFGDVEDYFDLEKYIMIFDDLERCDCSINDILGYINGLVEHGGIKVILVANEKEIGVLSKKKEKEVQYLVAANLNIKLPKKEDNRKHSYDHNTNLDMTLEELKRRRKLIFPDEKFDQQYTKLREKLIGVTIYYKPDIVKVIHILLKNGNLNRQLDEALKEKVNFFLQKMEFYEHLNFRTFQFFLSKINYLFNHFLKLEIQEKYVDRVLEFIVENCFILCVEYKADIKVPENDIDKIIHNRRLVFESIYNYVRKSTFDLEKFEREVEQYICDRITSNVSKDDPYYMLQKYYYLRPQCWVEEKIEEIIENLDKDVYPVNVYKSILLLFIRLKNWEFNPEIVEKTVNLMIANVKEKKVGQEISDELFMIDNEEERMECKRVIKRINEEITGTNEKVKEVTINDILNAPEQWAEKISVLVKTDVYTQNMQSAFLKKATTDKWFQIIINSDIESIQIFRECLHSIYPNNVILQSTYEDMAVMRELIDRLKEYEGERDLIKKKQLSCLSADLDRIYHRHTVELINYYEKFDTDSISLEE